MENLIKTAGVYYNEAMELIKNNNFSKAITLLDSAIKLFSKDSDILNLMGLCYYRLCNFDKAVFFWNESLKVNSKENKAEEYLELILSEQFKKNIELYNQAITSLGTENYEEAIRLLKKVIHNDKNLVEPYIIMCACCLKTGDITSAKKNLDIALEMDKGNEKGLAFLDEISRHFFNEKKNAKKRSILKNITITLLLIFIVCGTVLGYRQHKKYNYLIEKNIEYHEKIQKEADENISKTEKNDSLKIYTKLSDESDSSIFNKAFSHFKSREYDKALEKFEYIINICVEEYLVAEAVYFSAVICEKKSDFVNAEKFYKKYISEFQYKNYYDDSLYNYGMLLYKTGNKKSAEEILEKLCKEVPESIFNNSKVKYVVKQ